MTAMKLTAKVKLLPTQEQAILLRQTLETINRACDYVSQRAWESRTFGKYRLQALVYQDVRERFNLSAQVVVRLIQKVAAAYKPDRKTKRTFKATGAVAYDNRILNWRMADSTVSIWCLGGRQIIPFVCGPRQWELLSQRQGESDLALIGGQFFLFATCEVEDPTPRDVEDVVGVDLGVTNIAADSDGNVYSSAQVNGLRRRHRRLRQKLQAKGTKSAKRLLRKRAGKERRFATAVNHAISKRIVVQAQGTSRGIALEDLTGIRDRITARRAQRATLHSWSFYQLRAFIEYKAALAGVTVIAVDPRNTSRTCPVCGCVDKRNRPEQSRFSCIRCGFSALADTVAAQNIRVLGRAAVMQPYVSAGQIIAQGQGQATPL